MPIREDPPVRTRPLGADLSRAPAALIVSTGRARGVLTAARALSAAGWVVGVGTPGGDGLAARSRSTTHVHQVPRPRGDLQEFVAAIRRAETSAGYDVIFGGGDDWMAALSLTAAEFEATVAHPAADVVLAGLDKLALAEAAERVGIETPTTRRVTSSVLESWSGPVVIKCRSHWNTTLRRAFRIETAVFDELGDDALQHIRSIESSGLEAILQEPVDGGLGAVIGVFRDGRLHGRVQQRASRVWPTPTGVSSRAVTSPIDVELVGRCERLLGDLGWSGLVELQFMHDGDRSLLIDLNPRFFGSMSLAVAAAGNLPDAWGRDAIGRPAATVLEDAPAGIRYLWIAGDLRRAWTERRGGLAADLWSTVRWAASRDLARVWHPLDIGPSLHVIASRARRSLVEPEA